jgi:hypothetical protein
VSYLPPKRWIILICFLVVTISAYSQIGWLNYNSQNSPLVENRIGSIAFDKNNNLWVAYAGAGGTGNGVSKFNGTEWSHYTSSNSGLPNNDVRGIAGDNDGNVWFSCYNAGIAKFNGSSWTVYNKSNSGIVGNRAGEIVIDSNNNLWISAYFDGISKFDGTNWTSYNYTNSPFSSTTNCINTLIVDQDNNVWVGLGCSDGLAKLDTHNNTWKKYTVANSELAHHSVSALQEDNEGRIWIGYASGKNVVSRFDGTTWERYSPFNGISGGVSYDGFAKDIQGNIWMGGYGLYKFNGNAWERIACIGSAGELSSFSQSIAIDQSGNTWWAEQNGGIWTNTKSITPTPTSFSGNTVNASSISLSWKDESSNETGFQIERRTNAQNFKIISTTQPNTISYTDTELLEGTTYEYRIKGLNQSVGSSYSPCINTKTSIRPIGSDFELVSDEDKVLSITTSNFETNFFDLENDQLASVKILTLPELGFLTLSTQPVVLDQVIPVSLLSEIEFYPNENATGKTTFEVSMSDERDPTNVPTKITLNILPINDSPNLSDFDAIEIKTTELIEPIEFLVSDVDNPLQTLQIKVESSDQTLVTDEKLIVSGTGSQRQLNIEHNGLPGDVTIKISVSDLLSTTSKEVELSINLVTDVTEHNSISVFPNPTKSEIFIDFGNQKRSTTQIVIMDSSGKEIRRIVESIDNTQINLSGLNNGLYFISVRNKENQIIKTVRLNKQD